MEVVSLQSPSSYFRSKIHGFKVTVSDLQ